MVMLNGEAVGDNHHFSKWFLYKGFRYLKVLF